jgi:translation initiation factor 1
MNFPEKESRLVYSTNPLDRLSLEKKEVQSEPVYPPFSTQKIFISVDRKGRKGKTMLIVEGIQASESDRKAWLSALKKQCGSGGTLTEDGFQIQGEPVEKVSAYLLELGFQIKRK